MRNLHGQPRFAPDADGFGKRRHRVVGFVADVAHVNAAVTRCDARQRDDFLSRRRMPNVVFKPCRQSVCALAHCLLGEPRHRVDLLSGRLAAGVVFHHQFAECSVAYKSQDVDGGVLLLALRQIIGDRPGRIAVRADGQRRDALRHLAGGGRRS